MIVGVALGSAADRQDLGYGEAMDVRAKALLLALSLALAGCPKSSPPAPAVSVPDAPPSATIADAVPDASTPTDSGAARSELPEPFTLLAGACPAPDAGRRGSTVFCDASGRVTGVWAMVDTVQGIPPASAEVIHESASDGGMPGRSLVLALEGERLWFSLVSCGRCRRVLGWSFGGDLPKLTDEQLHVMQQRLGLPSDPPLRTAAAWRTAMAQGTTLVKKPLSAPPGVPGACINARPDKPLPAICNDL